MKLICTNTYLCTQTIFKTIGKPGARIDHHAGRVHLAQKPLGMQVVARDDGIGMVTGIGIDVTNYQRFPAIKNWTTVQSIIAYICNILIVILISIYIGQNVIKETASIVVK
jgi:hypothetical protein